MSPGGKEKSPNIIFLLTDDQRFDALGCMGNDEIQTPNIDRLASEGIIFDNHYNTTAICMASRASIMCGMYEFKTGCNFQHGPLSQEKFNNSYPVLLREAGYRTGFAGKFGFAVTPSADENSGYGSMDRMPVDQFDWWRGWPGQGHYQTEKNEYMKEYAKEFPHVSAALGAAARDFLRESARDDRPFCLSVSFKAPHKPVSPDRTYDDVYRDKTFTKPENFGVKASEHLPPQSRKGRQFTKLGKRWKPEVYDKSLGDYYQLIYGIDVAVGMIMDELEKQGLEKNTVIIYTTDNGYFCGSHGFGGKVLPYEEGSRSPLIIRAPGFKGNGRGLRSKALTGNIDFAPTILELAGLDIPEAMDGISLLPLLDKPEETIKDHQLIIQAWGEIASQSLSLVTEDSKYLYWFFGEGMDPAEELYDMGSDRQEMINLVGEPEQQEKLENMQILYDDYIRFWKKECVPGNRYPDYAILFDRNLPWDEKKDKIPEKMLK